MLLHSLENPQAKILTQKVVPGLPWEVVQWFRIRLPVQGTWIQSLVWEDSHMPQSNYSGAPQLLSLHSRAHEPQLLSPHAITTEACVPRACVPQQQKPPQ